MPSGLQRLGYAQVLTDLRAANQWLRDLGIPAHADRVELALRVVAEIEAAWEESRKTGQPIRVRDFGEWAFVLTEGLEFIDIFKAFANGTTPSLLDKLQGAISGPLNPAQETAQNAAGRNAMFELVLAAEWRLKGLRAEPGEPDITLRIDPFIFSVQCKRPFSSSRRAMESNVRRALSQLRDNLEADGGSRGIAAISVSHMLNPGTLIYAPQMKTGEEVVARLGGEVERLLRQYDHLWQNRRVHPSIDAVVLHAATPALLPEVGLSRATFTVVNPLGDLSSPSLRSFVHALGS